MPQLILHGSSHLAFNVFLLARVLSLRPISQASRLVMAVPRGFVCVCAEPTRTQQIRTHPEAHGEWQRRDIRGIERHNGTLLSFVSENREEAAG